MALSATQVLEIRQAGSDTNGGGFKTGAAGVDFSQQNAKNTTNQGTTTLSGNGGSISSGATTCLVASVTALYGSRQALLGANALVGDWIKIDSEIMKVTAVSSLTLTITRAQLGTSSTSHNDAATVTNISNVSTTDAVTVNSSTTVTSATAYWSSNIIGNLVYLSGGTNTVVAQWREITGVGTSGSNTTITVDATPGAATGGTGVTQNIGGAFATPGVLTNMASGIGGQLVAGQKAWWQYNASTYSCSTSTAGPAGPATIPAIAFSLEGYDVTRGDRTGNKPTYKWTINPGSSTYAIGIGGASRAHLANCIIDGSSGSNANGVTMSGRSDAFDVQTLNCATGFLGAANANFATRCNANGCTTGFSGLTSSAKSEAVSCTTGFTSTSAFKCLARACTTGFGIAVTTASNCVADSCGTGFSASSQNQYDSSIASNCTTGAAVGFATGSSVAVLMNCAVYNNTTHISGTALVNFGQITLSVDPYVSQTTADFRPNNNNPGGAQLRAAGIGVYGQTDNADIGAVQHNDPSTVITPFPGLGALLAM